MKRRILSLTLILCLALTLLPAVALADEPIASGTMLEGATTWCLDSTGELTVSGEAMENFTAENPAPWSDYTAQITKITISDGMKNIGDYAFALCGSVGDVVIPDSVEAIGTQAFVNCSMLRTLKIGSGVKSIGDGAFTACFSLVSVTIPASVENIGENAFMQCMKLADVTIGKGVKTIGANAFQYCINLESVYIPAGIESIGAGAFYKAGSKVQTPLEVAYRGSEQQWAEIEIGEMNDELTSGNIIYNYVENPFVDVVEGTPYYDAILWAVENNITAGTDATHFSPAANCTRGQVVTFLWRAAGCPDPTDDCPFVDVSSTSPYYKAIIWAAEQGITNGMDATHFAPNATVTRAQFVTFLWRYEDKPAATGTIDNFKDAGSIAKPYQEAVAWAVGEEIAGGYNDGTFRPNATCTRWAVVLFMYRDLA